MLGEIFYTLFIWPVYLIIELFFVLFVRIFDAPGIAVVFLSVVVNTLLLPIYLKADRWKKEENSLRLKMKKKLDIIRRNFKGDEKQMLTAAYYRQTGYSTILILKSSVGLLLQIPFFIAAYRFLSHTRILDGVSFLFIKNLSVPDALLVFQAFQINLLPIIMTVINILSSLIYAKNLGKNELVQLFALSFIFLVLLYNSPSGLVLYWTMNNIYSLIKNTSQAFLKKPYRVLQIVFCLCAAAFLCMIWTGFANVERYRPLFSLFALALGIIPFATGSVLKRLNGLKEKHFRKQNEPENTNALYYSSVFLLFFILALLNPTQVLLSSVQDFENPGLFIFRTFLQGLSLLVLIPLFIRELCPVNARNSLSYIWAFIALNAVFCYFALTAYYGVMDRNFTLDNTDRLLHAFPLWVNMAVPLFVFALISLVIIYKKINILALLFQTACIAVIILFCIDLFMLQKSHKEITRLLEGRGNQTEEKFYFSLSKTSPNVFIVFLDRAQGSAFSEALVYRNSLYKDLEGFVFYPNTISFGNSTILGLPPMLGGYNYTPDKINERKEELLADKVNSAIKTMPKLFGEAGYRVAVTDPVIANMQSVPDVSIFDDMANVSARLLSGKLSGRFRQEFNITGNEGVRSFDFDILFRYGIFRACLPALRYGIYYKGQWWREAAYNSFGRAAAEFSSLYYLNDICSIDEQGPALNILMNAITHEGGSYNAGFFPQNTPVEYTRQETERFGSKENTEYMYTLMAALTQLVKWMDYLKDQGVYDNTRILIVSDHGGRYLSGGDSAGMENFNPLFMVKDFNSRGLLTVSDELMTHADTVCFAAQDLVTAPENPEKTHTVFLASSSQPLRHGPYQFNLIGKRTLTGRQVLKSESWGDWQRY